MRGLKFRQYNLPERPMSGQTDTQSLISSLGDVVGQAHLLTDKEKKQPYCKGFRFGSGEALAVDIYSSDQRQDVPGPGPGQQLRGLQSVLGQVSKKYLLWGALMEIMIINIINY